VPPEMFHVERFPGATLYWAVSNMHLVLPGGVMPEVVRINRDFSAPVLAALRDIENVRNRHLDNLSAADRRELAACERIIAENIDLRAQLDHVSIKQA
jgi:hypothetical protein